MDERRKLVKLAFLLLSILVSFISIINFYTSTVYVRSFNFSEVKEAFVIKQLKPRLYSLISSSLTKNDQCQQLTLNKELCNISITVKTTNSNHQKKVKPIIQTWFSQLASQVYFITDKEDRTISRLTHNHLIDTKCGSNHFRESLSCKLEEELKHFRRNPSNWYCHFDDDNYLNVKRLFDVLKNYDFRNDWYIGKRSINHKLSAIYKNKVHFFSFATGGAGFCLSRSLLNKISPYIDDFVNISNSIGLPDDCSLGFIIESLIGVNLTENHDFHSHLEYLGSFNSNNLKNQVSLSYKIETNNFVNISPFKNSDEDPTKFKAIHCNLYSKQSACLE